MSSNAGLTVAQTARIDAQRVGHTGGGARSGAGASCGGSCTLRGVRRTWWPPWIGKGLTVLRP